MRIAASQIDTGSQHLARSDYRREERLRIETPAPPPAGALPPREGGAPAGGDGEVMDPDLQLLVRVIEFLSGREVKIARIDAPAVPPGAAVSTPPGASPLPFGVDYSLSESWSEQEDTRFVASGTVSTADGREIAFSLELHMQRRFESSTSVSFSTGTRKDPLAINFGNGPALGSVRHAFDLDGDGTDEQVVMASGSSAFLALDLDGNGRIDSGRELFGALSGDGFADLARHDTDGNGFIDEADPVFGKLLAFSMDDAGNATLKSLASAGVGALWLGSSETPFEIRDGANQSLAAVRRTGLYLNEDGSAGTLQQLDLVV